MQYFVITFAWTWSLWWTAAAASHWATDAPDAVAFMLFMTGGLGPLLGAAWGVRRGGPAYRHDFLRRMFVPPRMAATWWLALIAVAGGPALLGAIATGITGAAGSFPDYSAAAVGGVVGFALAAGLVEEPGWRGAASDAWQARAHPLWAALGIGVFWVVWHLPLYFIEGSYQHGLGFGSVRFWLTNLVLVELSVLYLWLANGSGGSILVAILGHAGFNAAGELVPRSTTGDVVAFLVVTAATVTVLAVTRGRLQFAQTARERPRRSIGSPALTRPPVPRLSVPRPPSAGGTRRPRPQPVQQRVQPMQATT